MEMKASETADSLLKLANCKSCALVVEGLEMVCREVAVIRRNGAKKNGTKKVTVVAPLVSSIMFRFSPWRTLKRALPRGDARPARSAAPREGGAKPEGDRAAYRFAQMRF